MFSFRKSCRARTHGTSYDDAQKINFVAIRRVGSVARALTADKGLALTAAPQLVELSNRSSFQCRELNSIGAPRRSLFF